jgi:histidyl-tRNA synthetase
VFEFEVAALGGRPTVGSGGRYDGLIEELGGPPTPGVGLAIGIEPTIRALLDAGREPPPWRPDVFVAWLEGLAGVAMATALDLRAAGLRTVLADEGKSLRSQLRTADRLGAAKAVILGPDEVARSSATVRDLSSGAQDEVPLSDLVGRLG